MKNADHSTLIGFAQVAGTLQSGGEADCQQVSGCLISFYQVLISTYQVLVCPYKMILVAFRGSRKRLRSAVNIADLRYKQSLIS